MDKERILKILDRLDENLENMCSEIELEKHSYEFSKQLANFTLLLDFLREEIE